ncbi:MAG: hypothetical protein ABIH82_05520 [Candidatus Woesearchaeota archaeon]
MGDLSSLVQVSWQKVREQFLVGKIDLAGSLFPSIRQVAQGVSLPGVSGLFEGGYVKAAIGVPGLIAPSQTIVTHQEAVLSSHCRYPPFEGVAQTKFEATNFARVFLNLPDKELDPRQYIVTQGGMQGCDFSMDFVSRLRNPRGKIILVDPGFPVINFNVN